MKQYWLVILGCLLLTSCQWTSATSQSRPMDERSCVAVVGGMDAITQVHLSSLLEAHGIDCFMGGSLLYEVSVPPAKRSEAVRVIMEDLRKRKYWTILGAPDADGKYPTFSVPESNWRTSEPKLKYADLVSSGDYAASTDLGALLRTREVMNETLAFRCVVRIKSLEREYMDSELEMQIGHEFIIELAVKLDEDIGGNNLRFQVWDNGKRICPLGAGEWWHSDRDRQQYDKRKKN